MTKARELAELGAVYDSGALSNRNLIINGAMQVAQRGTSLTSAGNATYLLDRFKTYKYGGGEINVEQSTDSPDDYQYSLKVTVGTADSSIGSTDYYLINQRIEGYNTSHLNFGSSAAKTVTLSFWVKSSLTGTFSGSINNLAENRSYPYSYTISSANTWEYKTVTISGDTTGTWATDNDSGIKVWWSLGNGSNYLGTANAWASAVKYGITGETQLIATASATFQITGVQLEVGSEATPFEHRSFGDELARCQRYYEKSFDYDTAPAQNIASVSGSLTVSGVSTAVRTLLGHVDFAVHKRAVPTITRYNPYSAGTGWSQAGALDISSGTYGIGTNGFNMRVEGSATVTDTNLLINWVADAEL